MGGRGGVGKAVSLSLSVCVCMYVPMYVWMDGWMYGRYVWMYGCMNVSLPSVSPVSLLQSLSLRVYMLSRSPPQRSKIWGWWAGGLGGWGEGICDMRDDGQLLRKEG